MTYAELIQPVLWGLTLVTSAVFGVRAFRAWRNKKNFKRSLYAAIAALLAAIVIVPAIAVIPPGNRGVVYRWDGGIDQTVRGEGVAIIAPWVQHLTTVSVRTQKVYSNKVFAQSSDLQEITVVASVNYHVDPDKAAYLYQHVGPQYATTVIQPALFQRTKAVVGQVKAEDFALQRDHMTKQIRKQLKNQLAGYGIIVEYVNIEDAIFDPAFVKAVKLKIIAQQKAKEQHNLIAAAAAVKEQTIINAEATARATLIKAHAQAKANKKIAASVTQNLLFWTYLGKWNGILPSTLVGSGKDPSLFLNLPATP